MSKKKNRYKLAVNFMQAATNIAASPEPVTEERLIVGELFVDLSLALMKKVPK